MRYPDSNYLRWMVNMVFHNYDWTTIPKIESRSKKHYFRDSFDTLNLGSDWTKHLRKLKILVHVEATLTLPWWPYFVSFDICMHLDSPLVIHGNGWHHRLLTWWYKLLFDISVSSLCWTSEFFLNRAELSLDSVNSVNSGKVINHWSMNWSQFKDPVTYVLLVLLVHPGLLHKRWQVRVLLL